jgi:hypothetical protein
LQAPLREEIDDVGEAAHVAAIDEESREAARAGFREQLRLRAVVTHLDLLERHARRRELRAHLSAEDASRAQVERHAARVTARHPTSASSEESRCVERDVGLRLSR